MFMIEMHVPGVNMDFGSAARLAAGMMAISRPRQSVEGRHGCTKSPGISPDFGMTPP